MKYSLQSLVDEYTRTSHYKPPTQYTPTRYTPTSYTPTYYSPTTYTPTLYTPTHYTPTQCSSALYAPKQSSAKSSAASGYASEQRASVGNMPRRRAVPKSARAVHFPNNVVFQDHIRHGDMQQIGRFLRAQKVRINKPFPSGMVALHEAVLTGNLDCVKLLVTHGADIHQRDDDGWTALHMACSDGYPEIARFLLAQGASTVAENDSGEKPADLIDPECKELAKLFEVGCV
ncbi:protein phosphatase 1 regulatory subunit 27 [Anguilla rostrata]|uniref:protein phosphatase 1 regulatory subunit 27 n=1 Tax=Anguilla rostrata TaxID=7938 RepID=UPI0030D2F10A